MNHHGAVAHTLQWSAQATPSGAGVKRRGRSVDQRLVHDAIELRKQGKKQDEIAVALGVAQGTVSVILRAHGWGGYLMPRRRQGLV